MPAFRRSRDIPDFLIYDSSVSPATRRVVRRLMIWRGIFKWKAASAKFYALRFSSPIYVQTEGAVVYYVPFRLECKLTIPQMSQSASELYHDRPQKRCKQGETAFHSTPERFAEDTPPAGTVVPEVTVMVRCFNSNLNSFG